MNWNMEPGNFKQPSNSPRFECFGVLVLLGACSVNANTTYLRRGESKVESLNCGTIFPSLCMINCVRSVSQKCELIQNKKPVHFKYQLNVNIKWRLFWNYHWQLLHDLNANSLGSNQTIFFIRSNLHAANFWLHSFPFFTQFSAHQLLDLFSSTCIEGQDYSW